MTIFNAWADEPWVNEGAAVRVSLISFGDSAVYPFLNGCSVKKINSDLSSGADLSSAKKISDNFECGYVATVKAGPFDIDGATARGWLLQPNPSGKPNSEVVKPWANGIDVLRRPSDTWIIDFGVDMPLLEASLYEAPFKHVEDEVKTIRDSSTKETKYKKFWLMARPIPAMRQAFKGLDRYIATSSVSKHRVFAWLDVKVLPDHALIVFARSDDTTFGLIQSRFHTLWALRLGTALEDRPRYTPTTCFETFPFPAYLTPKDTADWRGVIPADCPVKAVAEKIAAAAEKLNTLRETWLNPPEWVEWVITPEEEKAGFPKRPVAKPGHEADVKKRTLTNLYNARPAWLDLAHKELDAAVAEAYGWTDYTPDMPDEEILRRLLALNLERSAEN